MFAGSSYASRRLLLPAVRSLDHQIRQSMSSRNGLLRSKCQLQTAPPMLHTTAYFSAPCYTDAGASSGGGGTRSGPMRMPERGLPSASTARAFTMGASSTAASKVASSGAKSNPATDDVPPGFDTVHLLESFPAGAQSKVLRFQLPPVWANNLNQYPAPSGLYVAFDADNSGGADNNEGGVKSSEAKNPASTLLQKSYSPVSLPTEEKYLDLLVKAYPPRVGGGLGAFLCGLAPGESANMKMKAPRVIHGSVKIGPNRWKKLGLVGGGTGVAPLIQIVRTLLADASDSTEISMLCVNRTEADILMQPELEALVHSSNGRFTVSHWLTQPSNDASSNHGQLLQHHSSSIGSSSSGSGSNRGISELARSVLPQPASVTGEEAGSTMVMVCGTDGFVESWAGGIVRQRNADGKKTKVQGPIAGFLKEAGFVEAEVYKF